VRFFFLDCLLCALFALEEKKKKKIYLVRRLSLSLCLFFSVFFFFLPLRVGVVLCVFARGVFAAFVAGKKCNCGLGFRV